MKRTLEQRVAKLERILRCESLSSDVTKIRKYIIGEIGKANGKFLDVTQDKGSVIVNYYDEDDELVSSYKVKNTPDGYELTDIHELHSSFKSVIYNDLFELSLEIADNILSDYY